MSGASGRRSIVLGLSFLAVAVLAILLSSVLRPKPTQRVQAPAGQTTAPAQSEKAAADSASQAPSTASGPVSTDKPSQADVSEGQKTDDPFDYGRMPTVKPDANEDVKSVVEALKNQSNPERLTPLLQPGPFDPKSYTSDPLKYRRTIEPGRVYQSAQPAKDVPRIRLASSARVTIEQGQKTVLKVLSAPSWPVTFVSFSGGQFPNQLNCITVEANAQGVAETEFLATPGVIEDVNILAASPMASGQARWVVQVKRAGDGG